jgi:hypothetical protein
MSHLSEEQVVALARRLGAIPNVTRLDVDDEPQAQTIAHAIGDMLDSMERVRNAIVPTLLDKSLSPDDLNNALLDLGEELRHILYHARDTKYFSYLFDRVD